MNIKHKYILVILLLWQGAVLMGQTVIKDTLYISKHTMTHLVITEPIFMSDYGSSVVVTANNTKNTVGVPVIAEKEDLQVISLKARKKFKTPTNISIVTTTNIFYDIKCIYNETLADNYYYIDPKGVLSSKTDSPKNTEEIVHPDNDDEEVIDAKEKDSLINKELLRYYSDTVRYKGMAKRLYIAKKKHVKKSTVKLENIALQLIGVYGAKDKLYIKMSIYNGGTLPFHIGNWRFSCLQKKGFNYQESPTYVPEPIFEYNDQHTSILPKRKLTKVFVFDQFSLDGHLSLYVQLVEKELHRSPILEINNKLINKAIPLRVKWIELDEK